MAKNIVERKKIEEFVMCYMDNIEEIIFFINKGRVDEEDNIEANDKLIKHLQINRNNIENLLIDSGLDENINNIDKKDIKKILINNYGENSLPDDLDSFISTMFYSSTTFTQEDIDNYRKTIENYKINNDINVLYNLTYLKKDLELDNANTQEYQSFKKNLEYAFESLKIKDKAEALSNLNIFFEEYLNTDLGSLYIDFINEEYKRKVDLIPEAVEKPVETLENQNSKEYKEQFKKYKEYIEYKKNPEEYLKNQAEQASRDWLQDILECASNASPQSILKFDENNNQVEAQTQASGLFDGFYFINKVKLTESEKIELKSAKSKDEFRKHEKRLSHKKQIQINTTSHQGLDIEKDSVVRHSLSNAVFSAILNDYCKNNKDNDEFGYFLDSFSRKPNGLNSNSDMAGAISQAFSETFSLFNVDNNLIKSKKDSPVDKLEAIEKEINKNPVKFIKLLINKENVKDFNKDEMASFMKEIIQSEDLNKEEMQKFMKLVNDEKNIFEAKSYVSLYYNNNISKNRKLKSEHQNIISTLSNEEKCGMMQYSALLKSNEFGYAGINADALNIFIDNFLDIKMFSPNKKFDNKKLSSISLNDVDEYVLKTFVNSLDAIENNKFLTVSSKDTFSKIVRKHIPNADEITIEQIKLLLDSKDEEGRIMFSKNSTDLIETSVGKKLAENKAKEAENKAKEAENKNGEYSVEKEWGVLCRKYNKNKDITKEEEEIIIFAIEKYGEDFDEINAKEIKELKEDFEYSKINCFAQLNESTSKIARKLNVESKRELDAEKRSKKNNNIEERNNNKFNK